MPLLGQPPAGVRHGDPQRCLGQTEFVDRLRVVVPHRHGGHSDPVPCRPRLSSHPACPQFADAANRVGHSLGDAPARDGPAAGLSEHLEDLADGQALMSQEIPLPYTSLGSGQPVPFGHVTDVDPIQRRV